MSRPAFPTPQYYDERPVGFEEGMTLRDYLAAQAMALTPVGVAQAMYHQGRCDPDLLARWAQRCYEMAEAMLAARGEGGVVMTIREAYEHLGAQLPGSFCIQVHVWRYDVGHEPQVSYDIWDRQNHHQANTLEAAVARCLAAHAPAPADPLAAADAALEGMPEVAPAFGAAPTESPA